MLLNSVDRSVFCNGVYNLRTRASVIVVELLTIIIQPAVRTRSAGTRATSRRRTRVRAAEIIIII